MADGLVAKYWGELRVALLSPCFGRQGRSIPWVQAFAVLGMPAFAVLGVQYGGMFRGMIGYRVGCQR